MDKHNQEDPYGLRQMSHADLCIWIGGWKPGSEKDVAGHAELKRRQDAPPLRRANASLFVSVVAVLIALAAFLLSL